MTQYTTTHARGTVAYTQGPSDTLFPARLPDPIPPDAPAYDIEMAQAFGEDPEPHWELHSTNVVKDGKFDFYFFWTWKLVG